MKNKETTDASMKKYHIGCGPILAKGFLNIDNEFINISQDLTYGVVYSISGLPNTLIMKHDLRNGIPANSESVEVIYHSHFLEHLTRDEGRLFLGDCFRCLQISGVMRFAVPDFELWCTNYVSKNDAFFNWYKTTYLGTNDRRYQTRAQIFTGLLYNWGHNMAYDYETLVLLLKETGFVNIHRAEWGKSIRVNNIESIENNDNPRKYESLIIECERM